MYKFKINNIFDIRRFGLVLRKYLVENSPALIFSSMFVTVVMILIAMISGFSLMDSTMTDMISSEIGVMLVAFVFCGYLVASNAFRQSGDRAGTISLLTTPATAFEQCLARWIVVVPGFTLWSLVSAWAADLLKYFVVKILLHGNAGLIPWNRIFDFSNADAAENVYLFLLLFIFTQSFYFLGAIVWRKHNFIKTFLFMGFLFILYAAVMGMVFSFFINSGNFHVNERMYFSFPLMQVFLWVGIIINYSLTCMRLRETDLKHCW